MPKGSNFVRGCATRLCRCVTAHCAAMIAIISGDIDDNIGPSECRR
jgi:hypothetical protein